MAILLSHLTLALVEPPLLHRTGACNAAASPAEPTLGRRAPLTTAGAAATFATTDRWLRSSDIRALAARRGGYGFRLSPVRLQVDSPCANDNVMRGGTCPVPEGVSRFLCTDSSPAKHVVRHTRYVPRIERARDYWATKLRKDVATQNWAAIVKAERQAGS